ncbi:pseudouridine synthase [Caldalkalibacillus salinus]|uniref:pseudouridine synthase n=1 Tax=Caldalkalibacillus salinus TaxID=2803787 RepID=UPI0019233ADF|nr:pseudouridine synthase [Caldalkalibacillus salinus]
MRLDKLLANMGYGSRKEMKKWLKSGQVTVNGETIKDGKVQINTEYDVVMFQGEQVVYRQHVYLMLNKPAGVISATEDTTEETVLDLVPIEFQHFQPFPVGRLDKDTEGLLILTNDGQLAHQLLSPKKHVPKTYVASIDGQVTEADKIAFSEGVQLEDGYVCLPAKLHIEESGMNSHIRITIFEGKFHQIKRMFQARGHQVTYLQRVQMGSLSLDHNLELGEVRELTEEELVQLQQ